MLLNSQWITKEIKEEIEKVPRGKLKQKHDDPKPMGCSKSSSKMNFIAIQSYLRKQEKSEINDLNLYLKQLQKEEQKNPSLVEWKKS